MIVYLDNSATTRQYDEVTEIMVKSMMHEFGNPSSMHRCGLIAEREIKKARKQIENSLKSKYENIYFTSGGTEADNLAIFGSVYGNKRKGNKIITTSVEHPAVLESCNRLEREGFKVIYLPVDNDCRVNIEDYQNEIDDNVIFTSVMTVNNEVGTIQPIEELYNIKGKKVLFHTDCVQAFGKINIPDVDMISISGHKIHGPKGIGALAIKEGIKIQPLILGGGQEKNIRSGTENVPAIVGFGEASKISERIDIKEIDRVKSYLKNGLKEEIKDIRINTPIDSVPTILNISFLGTKSEVILHSLEEDGIYISAGSACSSSKRGQSHVLKAMGLKDREIEGALRFSLNEFNTIDEMEYVIIKLKNAVNKFRKLGSFR